MLSLLASLVVAFDSSSRASVSGNCITVRRGSTSSSAASPLPVSGLPGYSFAFGAILPVTKGALLDKCGVEMRVRKLIRPGQLPFAKVFVYRHRAPREPCALLPHFLVGASFHHLQVISTLGFMFHSNILLIF